MFKENARKLILMDFDGTMIRKDSLWLFLTSYYSGSRLIKRLFYGFPYFFSYKLGLVSNSRAKENVLMTFFKGQDLREFNQFCKTFASSSLVPLIFPKAVEVINHSKKDGSRVIIVSASIDNYISEVARILDVECIATKLEVLDGNLSGKYNGKNCYGEEKLNRLKEYLNLEEYSKIITYGDSKGDQDLYGISDEVHNKPFRS